MRYKRFEDFPIWRLTLGLTRAVYDVSSVAPWSRDFGLRDQARRATISISSNFVEGYEKNSINEFIRYLRIAKGSVGEVRNQLWTAKVLGYIDSPRHTALDRQFDSLARQIAGLIVYLERYRKDNS